MSLAVDPTEEKRVLRRAMRSARASIDPAQQALAAEALDGNLRFVPELAAARVFAAFAPALGEIDVGPVIARKIAEGATVLFPRIDPNGSPRLRFHELSDPALLGFSGPFSGRISDLAQLTPGAFGILEPPVGSREVPVEEIEVLLVPGLAFDPTGRRLGYGGGYYDEVGARLRAAGKGYLLGVGFDFQLIETCPAGPGDVPIDAVATDARVIHCH
jgi:5-formyltetrahydrofolate cyclo-ligase